MSFQDWIEAMKAKGHSPRMEEGRLDMFFLAAGYHNGPGCDACGWNCCVHCDSIKDITECTEPALELTATRIAGKLNAP